MSGLSHPLFDPRTACLTEQAMFDYIDGKLSERECHLLEKHVLDCAFCAEALEGLELVKDRSKVSAAVIPGVQPEDSSEKGGRIVPFRFSSRIAAAAVVILLIGSLVLYKLSFNHLEENKMAAKSPAGMEQKPDQALVNTPDDETFSRNFEPYPAEEPNSPKEPRASADTVAGQYTVTVTSSNGASYSQSVAPVPSDELKEVSQKDLSSASGLVSSDQVAPVAPAAKTNEAGPRDQNKHIAADSTRTVFGFYKNDEGKKDKAEKQQNEQKGEDDLHADLAKKEKSSELKQEAENSKKARKKSAPSAYARSGGDGSGREEYKSAHTNASAQPATTDAPARLEADKDMQVAADKKDTVSRELAGNKSVADAEKAKSTSTTGAETHNKQELTVNGTSVPKTETKPDAYSWTSGAGTATNNVQSASGNTMGYSTTLTSGTYSQNTTPGQAALIPKKPATGTTMESGMEYYRKKDYVNAMIEFRKTLDKDPADENALFYLGVSSLSLSQPDTQTALDAFNKILSKPNSTLADPAKWYKALTLIKAKRNEEAAALLSEISKSNSSYKSKAAGVQKELESQKAK